MTFLCDCHLLMTGNIFFCLCISSTRNCDWKIFYINKACEVNYLIQADCLRPTIEFLCREIISTYLSATISQLQGFPGVASCKEPVFQCWKHKRHRFDFWVGEIPKRRHVNSLHYSCLENPMDRGAWWDTVHQISQSWTWLKWLSTVN